MNYPHISIAFKIILMSHHLDQIPFCIKRSSLGIKFILYSLVWIIKIHSYLFSLMLKPLLERYRIRRWISDRIGDQLGGRHNWVSNDHWLLHRWRSIYAGWKFNAILKWFFTSILFLTINFEFFRVNLPCFFFVLRYEIFLHAFVFIWRTDIFKAVIYVFQLLLKKFIFVLALIRDILVGHLIKLVEHF